MLGRPDGRRRDGSAVSMRPRRPATASTPSIRYDGLKAMTRSSPVKSPSTVSLASPTSWETTVRSTPPGAHRQPDRRGVVPHQQPDPAQGAEQRLLAQVEPVRVVVGDQLAVVGVGALEQPGADPHRAVGEGDLVGAGRHGHRPPAVVLHRRPAPPSSRWSSARARAGTRMSSSSGSPPCPGQVPQGQAVGVGGHQPDAAVLGGQQHPGEQGRASSVEAARTTWRRPSASVGPGQGDGGPARRAGTLGNSTTGKARRPKRDRAAEISTFSSPASTVTAPGSSDRTMSAASRAGTTQSRRRAR